MFRITDSLAENFGFRQGRLQLFDALTCHVERPAGNQAQIQLLQVVKGLQLLEPRIGDLRTAEVDGFQTLQLREAFGPCIRETVMDQVEVLQVLETLEFCETRSGHLFVVADHERLQVLQGLEFGQPGVGDLSAVEIERLEVFQLLQVREALIRDAGAITARDSEAIAQQERNENILTEVAFVAPPCLVAGR